MTIQIETQIWESIVRQAVAAYPSEACGILAGPKGAREGTIYHPCVNVYDLMHVKDPETYPRTSKTAYLIDGAEQKHIFEHVDSDDMEVKSIVHSHTDHDAYFSDEDKYVAAPWGEPFFPKISYIVISIYEGELKEANEFLWNVKTNNFDEEKIT